MINTNPWIETHSGKKFFFLNPTQDMIDLHDIAHALSQICRYNGHTKRFYSVAEHCVYLAEWTLQSGRGKYAALNALHHDDAEAYIGDITRPLKRSLKIKAIEENIEEVIARKFGLMCPMPNWIKDADTWIIADERRHFLNKSSNEWFTDKFVGLGITPWEDSCPLKAKNRWLELHKELSDVRTPMC